MAAPARNMSVVYGSQTVGGTDAVELDGPVRLQWNYASAVVSFRAVVSATSDSTFATNCRALETAFRTPWQRLQLLVGSETMRDFNPTAGASGNTGFNAEPAIEQDLTRQSSIRKRFYRCTVVVHLPADYSGLNGLFWYDMEVITKPNNARIIRAWGSYTALGANDSVAQYTAQKTAFTALVFSGVSGTWEETIGTYQRDVNDKICRFERVWEELISDQSADGRDDTDIKRMTFHFRKTKVGLRDSAVQVGKPVEGKIYYSCTCVSGVDAAVKWDNELRAWLLGLVQSNLGASLIVLIGESRDVEQAENILEGELTITGLMGPTLSYVYTEKLSRSYSPVRAPVWTKDRDPFARVIRPGPQTILRETTHTYVSQLYLADDITPRSEDYAGPPYPLSDRRVGSVFPLEDLAAATYINNNWLLLNKGHLIEPVTVGIPGHQVKLLRVTEALLEEYVHPVVASGVSTGDEDGGPSATAPGTGWASDNSAVGDRINVRIETGAPEFDWWSELGRSGSAGATSIGGP